MPNLFNDRNSVIIPNFDYLKNSAILQNFGHIRNSAILPNFFHSKNSVTKFLLLKKFENSLISPSFSNFAKFI